jgi:hypothetical protein
VQPEAIEETPAPAEASPKEVRILFANFCLPGLALSFYSLLLSCPLQLKTCQMM